MEHLGMSAAKINNSMEKGTSYLGVTLQRRTGRRVVGIVCVDYAALLLMYLSLRSLPPFQIRGENKTKWDTSKVGRDAL